MRSLNFFAMGQNLQKDPTCDFSGLVKGSKGYLQAHFRLTLNGPAVEKWLYLRVWARSIRQNYLQMPA